MRAALACQALCRQRVKGRLHKVLQVVGLLEHRDLRVRESNHVTVTGSPGSAYRLVFCRSTKTSTSNTVSVGDNAKVLMTVRPMQGHLLAQAASPRLLAADGLRSHNFGGDARHACVRLVRRLTCTVRTTPAAEMLYLCNGQWMPQASPL